MRHYRLSAALVLLTVIHACASMNPWSKSLLITGASLKGIGDQFVTIGAAYKQGCDVTRTIPQPQCQSFRSFGQHFQKSFPLTVSLWEAARSANDKAMQDKVEDVILDLAEALTKLAIQVIPTEATKP